MNMRDQWILAIRLWILGRKMTFGKWINQYLIADIPSYFPDVDVRRLLICLPSQKSIQCVSFGSKALFRGSWAGCQSRS